MLGDVLYNSSLKKYVAILIGKPWPNSDLYWIESEDGLRLASDHKIVDDPEHKIYVTRVGFDEQPRHNAEAFYVYYAHSSVFEKAGDRNKDGKLLRRLITVR